MNSIDAMEKEIKYQLQDLPNLKPEPSEDNCLFVGAGDSYVASLAAQYASDNRSVCCYPMDLVLTPTLARGRNVYIVSISGNTRANILAASVAKRSRSETVAITANPASKLARSCDRVVKLRYTSSGIATAGSGSFTASMFVCLSIATKMKIPAKLHSLYKKAQVMADEVAQAIDSSVGSYVLLGNGALFPSAVYGALKFNEVFGAKAFAYPAEEFCHSPLFSLGTRDYVIVMGTEKDDNKKLDGRLRREGFSSIYVNFAKNDMMQLLFQSAFFMQLLVLKIARRRRLTECYFLKKRNLLRISSDFIYG